MTSLLCDRHYEPDCAADKNDTSCDYNAIRQCPDLVAAIDGTDMWDVVLDFSGYEAKWIHDNIAVLVGKVSSSTMQ